MRSLSLKKISINFFTVIFLFTYASVSAAHEAGATMDANGTSRSFTGMAFVTCFDDGNGPADNLIARVRDNSPPVPGLLVNLQIVKGNKSVSITDTVSGDANFSPFITLQDTGSSNTKIFWIMVNKTDAGPRHFEVEYHCNTKAGVHTGTDIGVSQFGEPAFTP